jgi:hypothetical protein
VEAEWSLGVVVAASASGGGVCGATLALQQIVVDVVPGDTPRECEDGCGSDSARDDLDEAEAALAGEWEAPPVGEMEVEGVVSPSLRARRVAGRRCRSVRTVKAAFAGRQLSYLSLNAKTLMSATKPALLWRLVNNDKMRFARPPDLIAVTEVGGASGSCDVRKRLGPTWLRSYDVLYSLRSTTCDGLSAAASSSHVGGGIALLVHKRLKLSAREFKYDAGLGDEMWRLDGHVRVWRLDAKPGALDDRPPHRSMVITVAYVPPISNAGSWGDQQMRDALFGAIKRADKAILELRRVDDVFAMSMGHFNAPDGGCAFDLCDLPWPVEHVRAKVQLMASDGLQRARLTMSDVSDRPTVIRPKCKSALLASYSKALVKEGLRMTCDAARYGKVPGNGVLDALHPTSWSPCAQCRKAAGASAVCNCGLAKAACHCAQIAEELATCVCGKEKGLHGTHDIVFFPSQVVFQALTERDGKRYLRYRVQRVRWAQTIDHCITYGHVWVAPVAAAGEADVQISGVQRRQPKRYRQSGTLWVDSAVKQAVAKVSDERLAKSHVDEEKLGAVLDADARAASIVDTLGMVRVDAEAKANELFSDVDSCRSLRARKDQASKACHRAHREQHEALGVWSKLSDVQKRDGTSAVTVAARQRKCKANQEMERALAKDREASSLLLAWHLSVGQTGAPKQMWAELKKSATDPGAPSAETMKLLECLRSKDGKVISRSRSVIIQHLVEHRRDVFSIRSDLGQECLTKLGDAAVAVHEMNRSLVEADAAADQSIHTQSAAARMARDPLHMARGEGVRLEQQQRAISEAMARRVHVGSQVSASLSTYRTVYDKFQVQCDALQQSFTVAEVEAAMTKMRDVGAGSDGVAPILLCAHTVCVCARCNEAGEAVADPGFECATAQELCRLFNQVWSSARIVDSWREHRLLLHYKGKGEDPHCVDNYRGLGIDQALLKLLSLVMLERLDAFATATGALSTAQGGFQRQRGTPEQAFTLSEVVRAAAQRSHVHLAFIDIERAYDSVLHPLLWKACIDKGVGGRFLALMQDVYEDARAVLDVGGVLLDAVPLECGVLQGNPLSPILFNLFIDGCIRELEVAGAEASRSDPIGRGWGLPLPRLTGRTSTEPLAPGSLSQLDLLASLFYADDGALMETRLGVLRLMLQTLAESLQRVGLRINVRKTKWLMVCRAGVLEDEFLTDRVGVKNHQPLLLDGAPIDLVDKFDYLGVSMNWRWNWDAAWRAAVRRGYGVFHAALQGGWHKRAGSLESQMVYARSSILCHLTYVAALAGAGGAASSAFWRRGEKLVASVLRTVTDCRFANAEALAVESGTWDLQTRIDMLLLRFWCKILVAPVESTVFRALCLSIRQCQRQCPLRCDPDKVNCHVDQVHSQTWAQQLAAAAGRFGIPRVDVFNMSPSSLVRLQASGVDGNWVLVPHPSQGAGLPLVVPAPGDAVVAALPGPVRFRWVRSDALDGRELKEKEHCWSLPVGTTRLGAFFTWSHAMRAACYASLKRRGNVRRQALVRQLVEELLRRDSGGLKKWARLVAYSFQQPYWRALDAFAARRLLRLRLDDGPYEDNVRRREFCRTASYPRLYRLHDPSQRVCYNCNRPGSDHPHSALGPVHGRLLTDAARRSAPIGTRVEALPPGVVSLEMRRAMAAASAPSDYCHETLEHMLLECTSPGFVQLRVDARLFLTALAQHPDTVTVLEAVDRVRSPDFDDDAALLPVLLLCTAVGPVECSPALHPKFVEATARAASLWVRALTDDWVARLRSPQLVGAAASSPGGRLVRFVADWARRAFLCHRKELLYRHDYHARLRDPLVRVVPVVPAAKPARVVPVAKPKPAPAPVVDPAAFVVRKPKVVLVPASVPVPFQPP